MRVAIPHNLGREEVRRRLRARGHEVADHFPGGMAQVTTGWPNEDRMDLAIAALGQELHGAVEIGEGEVVVEFALPPALGFIEPMVRGAVEKSGKRLLEPPKG